MLTGTSWLTQLLRRQEAMAQSLLTAFWIVPPPVQGRFGPLGFGVTGWSLEDALRIIYAFGYETYLPDDLSTLTVREGVTVAELDQSHVVGHMGPIVVRGMWYPFVAVGIPQWANDKLRVAPK